MTDPPRFEVIDGGRSSGRRFGGVRVVPAPLERPPFPVDAVVYQEDTFGVLAAPGEVRPGDDHPIRVLHDAARLEPTEPGRVFVVEDQPLRLHAVVCDLDAERPCRAEWIRTAFEEVLRISVERNLRSLGAEVLGAAYGHMPIDVAGVALLDCLQRLEPSNPSRVWLIVPGGVEPSLVFARAD